MRKSGSEGSHYWPYTNKNLPVGGKYSVVKGGHTYAAGGDCAALISKQNIPVNENFVKE